jgi:aldehyde dehydrogenase (NAD+)
MMDIIRPTDSQVIARVTLADEEDTRRAIAAARRAFATYGRSAKEERSRILRRLHEAVAAHIDDLTDAMVEEPASPIMDIGGWLRSRGLEEYEAAFRENKVDAARPAKFDGRRPQGFGDCGCRGSPQVA